MVKKAEKAYTHMTPGDIALAVGWKREGKTHNHLAGLLKRDPPIKLKQHYLTD